jgi:SPOR domain
VSSTPTAPPTPAQDQADTLCAQCGAELADDQEWCLECGGARTLIRRAPDWRAAATVVAIVVAVALGGFVVALIALSSDANRSAAGVATASAAAAPPVGVANWPAGLPGWTVVLASSRNRTTAYATAARVANSGIQVGVLNSSEHPRLAPHYWVVFSGRYATRAQALVAVGKLIPLGQPTAHPRLVGRPGA